MIKANGACDFGNIFEMDGVVITPKQNAYINGGSFNTTAGRYEGNWYEQSATGSDGNDYRIIWTTVDWDDEDEANACDWDIPDYIIKG